MYLKPSEVLYLTLRVTIDDDSRLSQAHSHHQANPPSILRLCKLGANLPQPVAFQLNPLVDVDMNSANGDRRITMPAETRREAGQEDR